MFTVNLLVMMSTAYKSASGKFKEWLLMRRHKAFGDKKQELLLKENKNVVVKVKPSFNLPQGVVVEVPELS